MAADPPPVDPSELTLLLLSETASVTVGASVKSVQL